MRYFGGSTVDETTESLGISVETAKRDWAASKAWLHSELAGKADRVQHGDALR